MNRIFTWHHQDAVGNETRIGPTYYVDAEYAKIAVRVYAVSAPPAEAEIDIFANGISIFASRQSVLTDAYGRTSIAQGTDKTSVNLPAGQNAEEFAENFNADVIPKGSWLHCTLQAGGGRNFTVQLELSPISEEDEAEE